MRVSTPLFCSGYRLGALVQTFLTFPSCLQIVCSRRVSTVKRNHRHWQFRRVVGCLNRQSRKASCDFLCDQIKENYLRKKKFFFVRTSNLFEFLLMLLNWIENWCWYERDILIHFRWKANWILWMIVPCVVSRKLLMQSVQWRILCMHPNFKNQLLSAWPFQYFHRFSLNKDVRELSLLLRTKEKHRFRYHMLSNKWFDFQPEEINISKMKWTQP